MAHHKRAVWGPAAVLLAGVAGDVEEVWLGRNAARRSRDCQIRVTWEKAAS